MGNFVDQRTTKQIRVDAGLHKKLKVLAAMHCTTVRDLVEGCLADYLPDIEEAGVKKQKGEHVGR